MTAHPHNALFLALGKIAKAQPPLPTWEEYKTAPEVVQSAIRERWGTIGSGYRGDGTQREAAFQLYVRAVSEMRREGKIGSRVRLVVSDDEEYPGEAMDRGLVGGGFNRGEE